MLIPVPSFLATDPQLAGALDCCHKIPNLPGHILSQLAEVEDLIPGQAMHAIQEEVEDDKASSGSSAAWKGGRRHCR